MESPDQAAKGPRNRLTVSQKKRLNDSNLRAIKRVEEREEHIRKSLDLDDGDGSADLDMETPLVQHVIMSQRSKMKADSAPNSPDLNVQGSSLFFIELPRDDKRPLVREIPFRKLEKFLQSFAHNELNSPQQRERLRVDLPRKQSLTDEKQYWLDIINPQQNIMDLLTKYLHFHPLSVDDCLHNRSAAHQKVEAFENYIFFTSTEVRHKIHGHSLTYSEIYVAVFNNLIVTMHRDKLDSIDQARNILAETLLHEIDDNLHPTVEWVLYSVLNSLIRTMGKFVDLVQSEAETLEEIVLSITAADQAEFMQRVSSARRRAMYLGRELEEKRALVAALTSGAARRAVGGQDASVLSTNTLGTKILFIGETPVTQEDLFHAIFEVRLSSDIRLHMKDIVSDIEYMQDAVTGILDNISSTTGVYLGRVNIQLSESSNDMGRTMQIFSAIGTIALPLGLVTSAWGMNVDVPGKMVDPGGALDLRWFFVIGAGIFAFAIIVIFTFWRLKWL